MCQKLRSVAFDWACIWGLAAFIPGEAATIHSHAGLVISSLCATVFHNEWKKDKNKNNVDVVQKNCIWREMFSAAAEVWAS